MVNIHWLPEAKEDLQRLHDFILPHSPKAAIKAIETILGAVDRLADFPETGKLWEPDTRFREWAVQFGAKGYVVRYRIYENQIIIVRVWHGLEDR